MATFQPKHYLSWLSQNCARSQGLGTAYGLLREEEHPGAPGGHPDLTPRIDAALKLEDPCPGS
jgi:hypothetical protein